MVLKARTIVIIMAFSIILMFVTQFYMIFNPQSTKSFPSPIGSFNKIPKLPESINVPSISKYLSSGSKFYSSHMTNNAVVRIAAVVIYVGERPPAWLEHFAFTAQFTSPIMDWFIFVTDLPRLDLPPNVHMIRISKDELYSKIGKALTSVYDSEHDLDMESGKHRNNNLRGEVDNRNVEFDMEGALQVLLEAESYMMVELKPCIGVIFEDYLTTYSHWAYVDIDTVVGRMHQLLTPEVLRSYDIYTISFGDNYRYYMRGQLTVHRNDPYVNNIWRTCTHLSDFKSRLMQYVSQKARGGKPKWYFVSAEGCYSKAVAIHKNISVMVAPGQISDAFSGSNEKKEWFQLGDTLLRCYLQPLDLNRTVIELNRLENGVGSHGGSTGGSTVNRDEWNIVRTNNKNCAYWVAPEFQVCLDYVPAGVEMYNENGVFRYNTDSSKWLYNPGDVEDNRLSSCRIGIMAHFQGWKRGYYRFFTRVASLDTHAVLYSSSGFIPIRLFMNDVNRKEDNTVHGVGHASSGLVNAFNILGFTASRSVHKLPTSVIPTYGELTGAALPYGRITFVDIQTSAITRRMSELNGEPDRLNEKRPHWVLPRLMGSGGSSSISAVSGDVEGDGLVTSYCGFFSGDLKKCICPILGSHIEIANAHSNTNENAETDVDVEDPPDDVPGITLIVVAWANEFYRDEKGNIIQSGFGNTNNLRKLLDSWILGPRLVVLGRIGRDRDLEESEIRVNYGPYTVIEVELDVCAQIYELQQQEKGTDSNTVQSMLLPEYMLFNIGLDASPTEAVSLHSYTASMSNVASFSFDFQSVAVGDSGSTEKILINEMKKMVHGQLRNQNALLIPPSTQEETHTSKCKERNNPKWLSTALRKEIDRCSAFHNLRELQRNHNQVQEQPSLFPSIEVTTKGLEYYEKAALLPIIFNTKVSAHGSHFVRFPEELDGVGCYGSVLFSLLVGSGYNLQWASPLISTTSRSSRSNKSTGASACGCTHGSIQTVRRGSGDEIKNIRVHSRTQFLNTFSSYMKRTSEFRSTQFKELYSREPYGHMFDKEQMEL